MLKYYDFFHLMTCHVCSCKAMGGGNILTNLNHSRIQTFNQVQLHPNGSNQASSYICFPLNILFHLKI